MEEAKRLFHDSDRTEFVIVTIPTMMAALETERLAETLSTEQVPAKTVVVNQVILPSTTDAFLHRLQKEQQRAFHTLRNDPVFRDIHIETAPMLDLEIRGIAALLYFASQLWK